MLETSADIIERVGSRMDRAINRIIDRFLASVPEGDRQMAVDTLRAVHQALCYHVGTVEHLILDGFGEQASADIVEKLSAERSQMIHEGNKHGAFHTTGSHEPH